VFVNKRLKNPDLSRKYRINGKIKISILFTGLSEID